MQMMVLTELKLIDNIDASSKRGTWGQSTSMQFQFVSMLAKDYDDVRYLDGHDDTLIANLTKYNYGF